MLKPKFKIILALFFTFMSGVVIGAGLLSADENGWTSFTTTMIICGVGAIILSCCYAYTVFETIVVEDKMKHFLNEKLRHAVDSTHID